MAGAGGLSSNPQPVTAKPVRTLALKGRRGDIPAEARAAGDRNADQVGASIFLTRCYRQRLLRTLLIIIEVR